MIVMLLWSLLLATSCEKMVIGESEGPADEDANVVVQVMSFEQQPFSLTQTRGETETGPTKLNFIVYDEGGMRIRQESQQWGDSDFGIARFKLQEGRYFLVALAHSGKGNPTSTNVHKIGFTNKTGYTDTFLYADSLVVGEEEVDDELQLKRIVSKVKFVFNDQLPEDADSIRFRKESWLTEEMRDDIAHYDNATRYNDHVLEQIIRLYEGQRTVVVYLSDHGEEVYDYRASSGRDDWSLGSDPRQALRYAEPYR